MRKIAAALLVSLPSILGAQTPSDPKLDRLKTEVARTIDGQAKLAQRMVDQVFSYGELGMQETETSKYLSGILEQRGFTVKRGVAGIPTAWTATWVSPAGPRPVISLGSDIDGIPQAGQKPGVATRDWIVMGSPGHGEGHNSGVLLNILAALAVRDIMIRERIPGTLMLWPGVAEEQLGSKAYYVRAGVFNDVDANLFAHVSDEFGISWGDEPALSLISAIFKFKGQSAHAAAAPWRGRSALDAVMNMANAWEFHREHMEPEQRSHYVITDGGDQPNVVPSTAAIWFYFRERDYDRVTKMFGDAKQIARRGDGDIHGPRYGAGDRVGVATALQQADRGGDARERSARRHAGLGRERSGDGEGSAAHGELARQWAAYEGATTAQSRGSGQGEQRHGQ